MTKQCNFYARLPMPNLMVFSYLLQFWSDFGDYDTILIISFLWPLFFFDIFFCILCWIYLLTIRFVCVYVCKCVVNGNCLNSFSGFQLFRFCFCSSWIKYKFLFLLFFLFKDIPLVFNILIYVLSNQDYSLFFNPIESAFSLKSFSLQKQMQTSDYACHSYRTIRPFLITLSYCCVYNIQIFQLDQRFSFVSGSSMCTSCWTISSAISQEFRYLLMI